MKKNFEEFCEEQGLGCVRIYQYEKDPLQAPRNQCMTREKIFKLIKDKKPNSRIRVFDHKCNELYEEDIRYIKNKVYVTTNGKGLDSRFVLFEYKPLSILGQGGQAAVMLVQHKVTGIQRALKFNLQDQEDQYLYLAREAVILENLNHKNIIKLYQHKLFPDKAEAILELEYLKGGSLLDYIYENGPMSENLARHIFKQIIDGLEYCHQKNIIHRDLKLENILISNIDSFNIKIIDFGLAYISNTGIKLNEPINIGTLLYAPPEIVCGKLKSILHCIDIWSIGVILYYLVFGDYPFQGQTPIQLKESIRDCKYNFPKPASDEFKNLIERIFTDDISKRITLEEIRNHRWVNAASYQCKLINIQISDLPTTSKESWNAENTFRKIITQNQNDCIQQSIN